MHHSQSDDKSELALSEHYRRQYDRNRHAHLRNSSHEAAQARRNRARARRHARYFLLIVFVFGSVGTLVVLAALSR